MGEDRDEGRGGGKMFRSVCCPKVNEKTTIQGNQFTVSIFILVTSEYIFHPQRSMKS